MKPLFWFSYAAPRALLLGRGSRGSPATIAQVGHMLRDGNSQAIVTAALSGYRYADTILNYPPGVFGSDVAEPEGLPVDALLLLATRPPLNDDEVDKKRVERSGTRLEQQIFASLRRMVWYCSRHQVVLTDDVRARASSDRLYHQFRRTGQPLIVKHGLDEAHSTAAKGASKRSTVAYLVYVPSIAGTVPGPGVLACFGMSGTATLVWSLHLWSSSSKSDCQLSLSKILEAGQPRIISAEIELPEAGCASLATDLIAGCSEPRLIVDVEFREAHRV